MYLSIVVILISGGYILFDILLNKWVTHIDYKKLSEMVGKSASMEVVNEIRSEDDAILPSFYLVYEKNFDLRGWLSIPGTSVDYPVVQTTDNKKYLDTDFFGSQNKNGCLFFDKSNIISKYNSSQCLVIYGHNMKSGLMFHDLIKYEDVDYYKKNPSILMSTVYEERKYKIFACFLAGAEDVNFYDYRKFNFDHPEKFLKFVKEIKEKSYFSSNVDIVETDSILLLSTCTYEFKGARLVVAARMIRSNEDESIDTESAMQLKTD